MAYRFVLLLAFCLGGSLNAVSTPRDKRRRVGEIVSGGHGHKGHGNSSKTAAARRRGSPTCLDGAGQEVDYWFVFRYPGGWEYAYMDADTKLAKSRHAADASDSALKRTLAQLYDNADSLSYALWNDEHPDGKKMARTFAHSKGVAAISGDHGFWLSHSLPKFPNAADAGEPGFDDANVKYGQHFFCVSVDSDQFSVLGKAMLVNRGAIYDSADNAGAAAPFKEWAIDQSYDTDKDTFIRHFTSRAGQSFSLFAKSGAWNDELRGSLVAPYLEEDLLTETWLNGKGTLSSHCPRSAGTYRVQNIRSVSFPQLDWEDSQDHSKWAVSDDSTILCMGDINRQEGQFVRGGGAICLKSAKLAKQLGNCVGDVERCHGTVVV